MLEEKYNPGVTVLTRTITLEKDEIQRLKRPLALAGIPMKVRGDQVEFKTAKIKTLAKLLNKYVDFGATDVETVLDIPAELGPIREEILDEAPLTAQQRRQRGRTMKKFGSKIRAAKKRMANRKATPEKLIRRARKKAISIVRQKVAGDKGKNYSELSPAEKMLIDTKVQKRKSAIERIAKRMLPKVRKADQMKRAGKKFDMNESFENFIEACERDTQPRKRFHELMTKDGKVKHDGRFKMYKKVAVNEDLSQLTRNHALQDKRLDARQEQEKKRIKSQELRKKIQALRKENYDLESDEEILGLVDNILESIERDDNKVHEYLYNKALETNHLYEVLEEVYNRGLQLWEENSSQTPQQIAIAGVNSFINEGKAYELNSDLFESSEILKKALLAIQRHVAAGKHLDDAAWEISRAKGVNMRPKELALAYAKAYGESEKTNMSKASPYRKKILAKYNVTSLDERFETIFSEEHGAGDEGTDKLRKRYKKDTPGQ